MTSLEPQDLEIKKIEVPDPEYMSEIPEHMKQNAFPGFPSTTLVCGPPGRGKTNLLMNLLTNPKMWRGFFDVIYAYGPTVKTDKLYKTVKLQPQNIVDDVKKIIPDLEKKFKDQSHLVEMNPNKAPKVLFLFEDLTSFFYRIQQNENFHRSYTQIRHVKGASIAMVHKYHAFHRTPRTSSQHIILFKTNKKDVDHLYEEFGPADMPIKQFRMMVAYALTPTEKNKKPFFYVNTMVEDRLQYRKNFDEILELYPNKLTKQVSNSPDRQSNKRKRGDSPEPDSLIGNGDRRTKRKRPDRDPKRRIKRKQKNSQEIEG